MCAYGGYTTEGHSTYLRRGLVELRAPDCTRTNKTCGEQPMIRSSDIFRSTITRMSVNVRFLCTHIGNRRFLIFTDILVGNGRRQHTYVPAKESLECTRGVSHTKRRRPLPFLLLLQTQRQCRAATLVVKLL